MLAEVELEAGKGDSIRKEQHWEEVVPGKGGTGKVLRRDSTSKVKYSTTKGEYSKRVKLETKNNIISINI